MILGDKHGICRLCCAPSSEKRGPLRESHIVSESCYSYAHRGSRRNAFEFHLPKNGTIKRRTIQKGHREYLFCEDCEQTLNKHEQVFAAFWKNNPQLAGPFTHPQLIVLKGLNYHHTKLFLLSVIWRASLSKVFGGDISLGTYSEKLRLILLKDKFVPQDAYPILGTLILNNEGYILNVIDNPICNRIESARGYTMCFGGCEWKIVMSDHWVPPQLEVMQHILNERGELHLITKHHSEIHSAKQLVKAIRQSKV